MTNSDWSIVDITGDGLLYSIHSVSFILSNTISGTKTFIFFVVFSMLFYVISLCMCV